MLWVKDLGAGIGFVAFAAAAYLLLGPVAQCVADMIKHINF